MEYQLRLSGIQYGDLKTGYSNNFARIVDSNAISKANTMFFGVADTMEL